MDTWTSKCLAGAMSAAPYFRTSGPGRYLATELTQGAWDPTTQHVASSLGVLVHAVEEHRDARRQDGLVLGRLSFDILGTMALAEVEVSVDVLRPGRTIELVEAVMSASGRPAVRLRAWLMEPGETSQVAGTSLAPIEPPEQMPAWDMTRLWGGGFIESIETRRVSVAPGHARYWVRTDHPLLDVPVSEVARLIGLADTSNGMAVRASPREVAFPNVDLTAHLFRQPRGEWLGLETTVSFGPGGIGETSAVLHDLDGPFGTSAQILTVRPGGL